MKTFYLAGPYGQRGLLGRLAVELAHQERARWYGNHDWTEDRHELAFNDDRVPSLVMLDLDGAVHADLFVLWVTDATSHGSHAELGARLATGGEAHVILNAQQPHMFYRHPRVFLHATWAAFLLWVREDALGLASNSQPPKG